VINRALEAICTAILAATVLIAFTAVIFRYVIGSALSWSFEASLALLTYLTFIGCYLALRKQSHLKVEVFVRLLPRLGQAAVFTINQLVIAGIGGVMLYHGTRQVLLYQSQNTLVMEIPVGVLYTAIPMSGLLMGLDSLVMLVTGLRRYRRGEPLLPPEDPAGQADARGGA
jgi:TRAP-type C4-dicarboxylate transport system permease small subunit